MGEADNGDTRQDRRDKRLHRRKARMPQHGRGFARAYRDAIIKRARRTRRKGLS